MNTLQSLPPETWLQESGPCSPRADNPSLSNRTNFLSLPPEILTQIANETHAADAYNLRLVHKNLYYLFRPENNLFWFKATLKDYIVRYGLPPKSSPSNTEASDSVPPDSSQPPFWDTLWRLDLMNRNSDLARGFSRLKEQLYKYDPNFKYFERIQTTIKEKRGCQICCVGSLQESKYFQSLNMRLCTFCFDDMTINRPKLRYLKLAENAYRFVKSRWKNGSVKYSCWLPDVLKVLPSDLGFTSIHDIERTHDLKYNATKTALSEYRDKTREAVQRAAIEVFSTDPSYEGFRAVFPVDKMEDYVYELRSIASVEEIVRLCKRPKTKVWCMEVARKDILPKFDLVDDEDFQGQRKYVVIGKDEHRKPIFAAAVGQKKVLKADKVAPAIRSAVLKYHEKRFVKLGAGWDHRGMQADDKLMFGFCQICMDKKLKETGDLQKVEAERRKRKRDVTDDGNEEQEAENVDAERPRGGSQLLPTVPSSQQLSPSWTGLSTSAYPTPISPTHRTTSSPTPLSLSTPSVQKRQKQTHHTETEIALAKYLPQLYTAETAASFPTMPRRLVDSPQQVKYTGAELAAHYEACHPDRFYSGEAQGPARRYERGKEGYWFWNLGDNVDEDENQQTERQPEQEAEGEQGQTELDTEALAANVMDGQLGDTDINRGMAMDALPAGNGPSASEVDSADILMNSFDLGQGSSFRPFTGLDSSMRFL